MNRLGFPELVQGQAGKEWYHNEALFKIAVLVQASVRDNAWTWPPADPAPGETLYHDLSLVTTQVGASVLCPYFVPTGIIASERNRPADMADEQLTPSQRINAAMTVKAVESGRVSAAEVAQKVFDAAAAGQFYIYSHPQALGNVSSRMDAIVQGANPPDPFAERPQVGEQLRAALRGQ